MFPFNGALDGKKYRFPRYRYEEVNVRFRNAANEQVLIPLKKFEGEEVDAITGEVHAITVKEARCQLSKALKKPIAPIKILDYEHPYLPMEDGGIFFGMAL